MFGLDDNLTILLLVCIAAACIFEFINGFHDTANAVATVIYTNSLRPLVAVIWSGICNFAGVYLGGIAVAVGIINLLPTEALVDQDVYHNVAMILALILTAVVWNLATWYIGIPCSSSHTLIGSIFGVGIAFYFLPHGSAVALNWSKVTDIGLSLLISPFFGFMAAMLLMFLHKKLARNPIIFQEPEAGKKPPIWVRATMIATCTSVSFSHGSNDGQKGVGLMMIILIGIAPAYFAVDIKKNPEQLLQSAIAVESLVTKCDTDKLSPEAAKKYHLVITELDSVQSQLQGLKTFEKNNGDFGFKVRKSILLLSKSLEKQLIPDKSFSCAYSDKELSELQKHIEIIKSYTEYSPWWVVLIISLSLGLGTMVGWRRIVVTIGEKIGKTHLNYAQGVSSEVVAASTISISTMFGLPVSTTHVLSSGVAGSMVAGGGLRNLQYGTVKNILIAWLITLPVTIVVACLLFLLFRALL